MKGLLSAYHVPEPLDQATVDEIQELYQRNLVLRVNPLPIEYRDVDVIRGKNAIVFESGWFWIDGEAKAAWEALRQEHGL